MADPNQKLFSQIADLGRNINSLSESIKKNTSATEALFSATEKSEKKEKESATTPNKANTAIPNESEKNDKSIKDLTKVISTLLGEGGPLMSKIAGIAKGTNKGTEGSNKDFTNIAGGLKGIIKAFQEGGVAQKEGKYLVGENGPEVVKLPKGSGVIPINVKDLMEGLKKVPEFREILKNSKNDTIDFFGSDFNPGIIDTKGKLINLSNLSDKYQDEAGETKNKSKLDTIDQILESIDSLSSAGVDGIQKEILRINGEQASLASKSKLSGDDLKSVNKIWDGILDGMYKDDEYPNPLSIAKAKLLATQTFVKENSPEKSQEETIAEAKATLSKLNEPGVTKESLAELKKASEVVNPEEAKKEKKGLFSKSKKEKKPEKVESLESLAAKEPVFGNKAEEENKDNSKQENKKSSLLSKAGKSAEGALFSAVGAATDKLGIGGPLAKKGLGALKKSIDNKEKGNEPKSAENKTELSKGTTKTPSLVRDVKKLAPTAKNEPKAESKEAPESKSSPKSTSTGSTSKETPKSEPSKKSESKGESTSELGTSKDIQDIKNALTRMASILEGPLTVYPMETPFRPDSRRI